MIWPLLALQLYAAAPCADLIEGPIDSSAFAFDLGPLRDLEDQRLSAEEILARTELRLVRATARAERALARLDRVRDLFLRLKWPWPEDVRRALRLQLARDRAEIARNVAKDKVTWLRLGQWSLLEPHPDFKRLSEARSLASDAACDSEACLRELETIVARIEAVRGTEEWELNHAFDPRFDIRVDQELAHARHAFERVNLMLDRLLRRAKGLGLADLPGEPFPHLEHHGAGVSLGHAAEELNQQLGRVRHLNDQLIELRAKLEARAEEYRRVALDSF